MKRSIAILLAAGLLGLAGCQGVRYRARESHPASGLGFQGEALAQEVSLKRGRDYSLHVLHAAEHAGLYYLQVAPGQKLPQRYHAGQDLTLVGISGEAIVEVEQRRYRLKQGASLFIPSEHAYTVLVPEDGEEFAAYVTFAPPYDPEAVELTGEQ